MCHFGVVAFELRHEAMEESADHDLRQGPLVGQRQPSSAITTEYASADPVFQAKTAVSDGKLSGMWSMVDT